ncbi:hypothetical protein CLOM_g22952 [Closterium sp. NIES-68]|nr:hypothetical protein CLOM_g22952 [Closterium sp. NIES-68]GJP57506.1 hypothetical protein CLOP_g12216 [Closterium sp. NIES-67]
MKGWSKDRSRLKKEQNSTADKGRGGLREGGRGEGRAGGAHGRRGEGGGKEEEEEEEALVLVLGVAVDGRFVATHVSDDRYIPVAHDALLHAPPHANPYSIAHGNTMVLLLHQLVPHSHHHHHHHLQQQQQQRHSPPACMTLCASGHAKRQQRCLSLDGCSPSPLDPTSAVHTVTLSLPRSATPHREQSPLMHGATRADTSSQPSSPILSPPPAAAPAAGASAAAGAASSRVTAVLVARTFPGVLDRGKGYALLSSVLANNAAAAAASTAATPMRKDPLSSAPLQAELHLKALATPLRAPAAEEEPLLLYPDAPRAYLVQPAGPGPEVEAEMREMKEQSMRQLEDELDLINELICQEEEQGKHAAAKPGGVAAGGKATGGAVSSVSAGTGARVANREAAGVGSIPGAPSFYSASPIGASAVSAASPAAAAAAGTAEAGTGAGVAAAAVGGAQAMKADAGMWAGLKRTVPSFLGGLGGREPRTAAAAGVSGVSWSAEKRRARSAEIQALVPSSAPLSHTHTSTQSWALAESHAAAAAAAAAATVTSAGSGRTGPQCHSFQQVRSGEYVGKSVGEGGHGAPGLQGVQGGPVQAAAGGRRGWSVDFCQTQHHSQPHSYQQQHGRHDDPTLCSHPLQPLLPEQQQGEEAEGAVLGAAGGRAPSEMAPSAAMWDSSALQCRSLGSKASSDIFPKRLGGEWGKVLRKGWSAEYPPGATAMLAAAAAVDSTTAAADSTGVVVGSATMPALAAAAAAAAAAADSHGLENQDPKLLSRPSHPHAHLHPLHHPTPTSPGWSHHLSRSLKLNPDLSRVSPAETFPSAAPPRASVSFCAYPASSSSAEPVRPAAGGSVAGTERLAATAAAAAAAAARAAPRVGVEGGEGKEQSSGEVRRQLGELISRWAEGPLAAAAALGGWRRGGESSAGRTGREGYEEMGADGEEARGRRGNSGSMFGLSALELLGGGGGSRRLRAEGGGGSNGVYQSSHAKKQAVCEITEEVSGGSRSEAAAVAAEAAAAAAACSVLTAAMRGVQPDLHVILPNTTHSAQQQQQQQQQQHHVGAESDRAMAAEIHSLLTGLQEQRRGKAQLTQYHPGLTPGGSDAHAGEGAGSGVVDGVKDGAVHIEMGEEHTCDVPGMQDTCHKNPLVAGPCSLLSSRLGIFYKCAIVIFLISIIVCACFFIGWIVHCHGITCNK